LVEEVAEGVLPLTVVTFKVELPADVDKQEILITLAVILYKEGKLTLKQAADLAGLSVEDFLLELGKRKVSFTNITLEELREELEEISSN